MSRTKIIRILLSLFGLAIGIMLIVATLRTESPNKYTLAGSAAFSLFSIGWLFNLRLVKIITGILLVPVGLAGAIWTIWDFILEIFNKGGVIGNIPLLGYGMTIFLLPNLLVLGFFCWIVVVGVGLVRNDN